MTEQPERVNDHELHVAARDACVRFFGDPPVPSTIQLAATSWADPGHDIMADLREYAAMLEAAPPPPQLRVEVDAIALDYIRDTLGRQPADAVLASPFVSPLAALASIPIVLDDKMPLGGWRIVDTDGNVRAEGNVLVSVVTCACGHSLWEHDRTTQACTRCPYCDLYCVR